MASYTDLSNAYIPEKTGGTKPVTADYTIWITEALQLIINASPPDMLWLFETSESDAGEDGVDIGTNKILYVLRESDANLIDSTGNGTNDTKMLVECREVPAALRGRLTPGSGWMEEVSETDPVFFKKGKLIWILPTSASVNTKVYWIKNPPTDSDSEAAITGASNYLSGTSGVPAEVDPMVLSWCIYKGVSQTITKLLTEQRDFDEDLHSNESIINVVLDKANTLLGECDSVNNKIDDEIASSKSLISKVDSIMDDAIGELDEAIIDTDSDASGDFATAITNMKNALAEYSTYQTGGKIDGVQGAVQNAQGLINGSLPSSEFDAFTLIKEEELDILQGVIQTAGAELQRAQSYLAEWQAASTTLNAEVQGFASEVQTRSAFVQAKSVVWQGAVAVAQGYLAEIQSNLAIAQAYGTETQSRLAVVQGYTNESAARLSLIASKVAEKKVNQDIYASVYQEMMACQNKYLMEFTQGLAQLHAGTYKVESKDIVKNVPTYTGISE
tara:strand:- start:1175 stop:2680 length:1506 start_codon:yes stop_codon:yes gene_type:complete